MPLNPARPEPQAARSRPERPQPGGAATSHHPQPPEPDHTPTRHHPQPPEPDHTTTRHHPQPPEPDHTPTHHHPQPPEPDHTATRHHPQPPQAGVTAARRPERSEGGGVAARYHAELAWVGGTLAQDVLIEVAGGRFTALTPGAARPPDATRLSGLVLPGLANAHSHAFHRALRGRTHTGAGDFWTWREQMYRVAAGLDPDSYLALATAAYAEMALAGITCVGEFHYLHHGPDGRPYADRNAMGLALLEAARRAGIRITLLDTLYLTSTVAGEPLRGVQRRFGDRDLDAWYARSSELAGSARVRSGGLARVGAAVHSVRAVPAGVLTGFAASTTDRPVHLHLSEQPAENEACRARHGCSPTELLDRHGLLGPRTTAVHATHLSGSDIALLGRTGTAVCLCPTTERDLADGIGPGRSLASAGSPLCLGSDSHAVVDLFEEARAVEMHERLRTRRRGHFDAAALLRAASAAGHAACGWDDAGVLAVGARADLVAVRLDSPRTAGVDPAAAIFAATAADVTDVVADGRPVVRGGRHVAIDTGTALLEALRAVRDDLRHGAGAPRHDGSEPGSLEPHPEALHGPGRVPGAPRLE